MKRGEPSAQDRYQLDLRPRGLDWPKKYQADWLSLLDLIQRGSSAILAVEKFDWRRGYNFRRPTLTCWWIPHLFKRGVANKSRSSGSPSNIVEREQNIAALRRELTWKLERPADQTRGREDLLSSPSSTRKVLAAAPRATSTAARQR